MFTDSQWMFKTGPAISRNVLANIEYVRVSKFRKLWSRLHKTPMGDESFFRAWASAAFQGNCPCKTTANALLATMPPRYDSPDSWFDWTIEFHNAVNAKLNKPTVSLQRARMLWRHERPATDRQRAIVTVANGTEFVEILKLTKPYMRAYADRCGADLIDLDNDTEDWGPMEKFRTFHFAKQYEHVMFVDADCIITDRCPDLFDMYSDADIVALDESKKFFKRDWLTNERAHVAKLSGLAIEDTERAINSGVVLVNQSAADIWSRPLVDIGTTHCAEQIYLGHQIEDCISSGATYRDLDIRANWQWWYSVHEPGAFEAGLKDAWIIHFANAPNRYRSIKEFLATSPKECCHGMDCSENQSQCCRDPV